MNQGSAPVIEVVTHGFLSVVTPYNAGFGVPAIFGRPSESLRVGSGATSEFEAQRSFINDMSITRIWE